MLVMTVAQAWSGERSFLFDLWKENVAAQLVFAEVVMLGVVISWQPHLCQF